MKAGQLRYVIKIEKRKDVVSPAGQSKATWSSFANSVPASFEPARGREYFEAKAMTVVNAAAFKIRYKAGVVPEMRIIFRDQIWDIADVEEIGRNVGMILYCATGLTEG